MASISPVLHARSLFPLAEAGRLIGRLRRLGLASPPKGRNMSAVINPTSAVAQVAAASQATPQLVLQPGTVIDARVLAVRENLARILIAGLSLEVLTEVALQPGANLKLAVSQTAEGVRLAVVPQDAAAQAQAQVACAAGQRTTTPARPRRHRPVPGRCDGAGAVAPRCRGFACAGEPGSDRDLASRADGRAASGGPVAAVCKSAGDRRREQRAAAGAERSFDAAGHAPAARQHADRRRPAPGVSKIRACFWKRRWRAARRPQGAPDLKAALVVFKQVLTSWLGQAAPAAQLRGRRASVGAAGDRSPAAASASARRTARFAAAGGHGHVAARAGPSVRMLPMPLSAAGNFSRGR